MTLVAGTTVGRYQILEPLGQGGMATVYKAFQPSLQREVALKVLRPGYAQDAEFLARFEREAIAIARLRHPHIVQVFDFEAASGQYVLAMEYLEGGTLKERLAELGRSGRLLDQQQAVRIVAEVADALSYAHEQGIVHRDVKPSNVMLTRKDRAVVTDFGIARILGATSHTQTGVGIGTPEYMAPEQGQGSGVDHRADIYSLGVMAYELFTGRVPYAADTPLAVVLSHIRDPLPLPSSVNPQVGSAVEKVLLRALAKDPAQRHDSATDLADSLRAALSEDQKDATLGTLIVRRPAAGAGATAPTVAPTARSVTLAFPPLLTRRPVVLGIAGALVLVLVAGTALASGALRGAPAASNVAAPSTPGPGGTQPLASPPRAGLSFAAMRGAEIFAAKLASTDELSVGGPNGFVKVAASALEITTPEAGTRVEAAVGPVLGTQYAAEMDVRIVPGSSMRFAVCLRADGAPRYCFTIIAPGGTASVKYLGSETDVGAAFGGEVPGGAPAYNGVRLGVVVDRTNFTVFVDERAILQVSDPRIANSRSPLSFQAQRLLATPESPGTARVSNLRLYALAAQGAASPTPAPGLAVPAKGPIYYQAKLDGSAVDVVRPFYTPSDTDPTKAEVRTAPGAIELISRAANAGIGTNLNALRRQAFIAELEISGSAAAGSEVLVTWVLRSCGPSRGHIAAIIDLANEQMYLDDWSGGQEHLDMTVRLPLAGMKSRPVTLAAVLELTLITIFIDQKQVARFPYSRCVDAWPSGFGINTISGSGGIARITGIRLYNLP